ncbi:SCO family protein [Virgibacillus sp. W0430]|uniref:SCO family protein n=1 Tax=Virgibacillus sp. W0430 TaxID=3391580 RepID=UPI003F48FFB4
MFRSKLIYLFLIGIGFMLLYFLLPNESKLDVYGRVPQVTLESLNNESYPLDNNQMKLVIFYFSNCPDICPLTLMQVKQIQNQFKEEQLVHPVSILSITLDPEYDTEEVIKEYAQRFSTDGTNWYWLRGSSEKTKEVADSFNMFYKKSNDGFVSHSTTMYLVDKKNQIRGVYDMATSKKTVDIEQIVEDIRTLDKE